MVKAAKGHLSTVEIAQQLGIMPLSPSQGLRMLHHAYEARIPLLFLGRPGVGKTSLVGQFARSAGLELIVERLNGKDPTDLGLPFVYDRDGVKCHGWTIPDFIPTVNTPLPEGKRGWIIFLDEFAQALPAMQARVAEWLDEAMNNRVVIHPSVFFVLAANFAQDKAATYPIPRHILNRVLPTVIVSDEEDFRRFCSVHDIRPEVMAFSKLFPDCLDSYDPDSMVNCTPRSLVSLSRLMDTHPSMEDELALYSGRIGQGYGSQFTGFLRVYRNLPRREDIEKDPMGTELPDEDQTDVMCALAAMLGRALDKKNAAPLVKYLTRLPAEFCVFALRDAVRRDPELKKTKPLTDWAVKHGDVLI